jgi:hypothetical protein
VPKLKTKLESEGAEFLVLGHLLVEGMQAYKMYTNMPGYDVLVVNPEAGRQARVSVKSRWRAGANGFIIKNLDSDFVVVVKLNRDIAKGEVAPSQFFVIPTEAITPLKRSTLGKANFAAIPDFQAYLNAWHRIRVFLGVLVPAEPNEEDIAESSSLVT